MQESGCAGEENIFSHQPAATSASTAGGHEFSEGVRGAAKKYLFIRRFTQDFRRLTINVEDFVS